MPRLESRRRVGFGMGRLGTVGSVSAIGSGGCVGSGCARGSLALDARGLAAGLGGGMAGTCDKFQLLPCRN